MVGSVSRIFSSGSGSARTVLSIRTSAVRRRRLASSSAASSTSLLGRRETTAAGELHGKPLSWLPDAAVDVVIAAEGYPERPETGRPIAGIERAAAHANALVFHAGTERTAQGIVSRGGRVLNVVGTGPDIESAREAAYDAVAEIELDGMHYRKDIAL